MTLYEIIEQKEQEIETLTREIAALRMTAQMLEETSDEYAELVGVEKNDRAKLRRQFP